MSWDDYKLLQLFDNPDMRRRFRALLHQQAREEERHRGAIASVDLSVAEALHGERSARFAHGTGGGRRRACHAGAE